MDSPTARRRPRVATRLSHLALLKPHQCVRHLYGIRVGDDGLYSPLRLLCNPLHASRQHRRRQHDAAIRGTRAYSNDIRMFLSILLLCSSPLIAACIHLLRRLFAGCGNMDVVATRVQGAALDEAPRRDVFHRGEEAARLCTPSFRIRHVDHARDADCRPRTHSHSPNPRINGLEAIAPLLTDFCIAIRR